jgi:ketol-acid reductoisomerase
VQPFDELRANGEVKLLTNTDIDPAPLAGKRVTILGYGNQGRAQALNLRDSGIDVVVGLRDASGSTRDAASANLATAPIGEAVAGADVVMMLAPDEVHAPLYGEIEPHLREGVALGFSHGLSVRFDFVAPRADLDVFMIAPKGPGTALRSLYEQGRGMIGLWAVEQNATGEAERIALAYGQAIGCGRAGLIRSSFAEECEADLFNEQAVVWGAVPELLLAGLETLVDGGVSPEVAFLECVGELKLLAELIEMRGIAGMREAISNTAELGALLGGKRIVDQGVRARMVEVLSEVRRGQFADELRSEEASGYARLRQAREEARKTLAEQLFTRLAGK